MVLPWSRSICTSSPAARARLSAMPRALPLTLRAAKQPGTLLMLPLTPSGKSSASTRASELV
jgi:hypothetical protein